MLERELWCPRRKREARHMLAAMVWAMEWDTGLVAGVTRAGLAQLADRSPATVSRLWRWAENTGLLARVEQGASAAWLDTETNRSAVFAFTTPTEEHPAPHHRPAAGAAGPVDESANPPTCDLEKEKPLERPTNSWPTFQIPTTPSQRRAAAHALLARIGLDPRRLPRRRLYGLLRPWWDNGACIAGLLWAIDHHPERPDQLRGDALRGARDPLGVLGHRLTPWSGRLTDLPTNLQGLTGDYRAAQNARLASLLPPGHSDQDRAANPASRATRAAAAASLRAHLATLHRRRAGTTARTTR